MAIHEKYSEKQAEKILSFQIEGDRYKLVKTRETTFEHGTKLVKVLFYKNERVVSSGWYNTRREKFADVNLRAVVWNEIIDHFE